VIIAIDGSAASGKGTLAKAVARHFDYDYLDTGALYRALALSLMDAGANLDEIEENQAVEMASTLDLALTQSPLIRSDEVAGLASKVAAIGPVRQQLLALQRHFARAPAGGRGAVLDGRDIGTVVLPDADVKFFIDAAIEVRAARRTKELLQAGQSAMFRDVLAEMQARDERDRTRSVAPLRAADDAITIDTSDVDASTVLARALAHITGMSRPE
jgi:cytidylate kinase